MRYAVDVMSEWGRQHGGSATLAAVYIEEAHATDEWPITSQSRAAAPVAIPQHKTLGDREAAARAFVGAYNVDAALTPVFLDTIENGFQSTYAAWPLRWYVFALGGADGATPIVANIGVPEEASFDLSILDNILVKGGGGGAGRSMGWT